MIINEVKILKKIQSSCNPNITCNIDFSEDDKNYYILPEFLGNYVTLFEVMVDREDFEWDFDDEEFDYSQTRVYTLIENLAHGLKTIHFMGIAHLDIIQFLKNY